MNKELRIGNLIQQGEITMLSNSNVWIGDDIFLIDEIEPIPLTEEWLLKFGFEKDIQVNLFRLKTDLGTIVYYPKNSVEKAKFNFIFFMTNTIKHVHQLQNLYFAITGKEL